MTTYNVEIHCACGSSFTRPWDSLEVAFSVNFAEADQCVLCAPEDAEYDSELEEDDDWPEESESDEEGE